MKFSFSDWWQTLKNFVSTPHFRWSLSVGMVISAIILTLTGLWLFLKMAWTYKFLCKLTLLILVTALIDSMVLHSREEFDRLQSERPESIRCRFHRLEYKRPQFSTVCEHIVIILFSCILVSALVLTPDVVLDIQIDFLPQCVNLNERLGNCLTVLFEFVISFTDDVYQYRFRLVSLSCLARTCDLVYRKRHKYWEGYSPQFGRLVLLWVLGIILIDFLIPFLSWLWWR